MKENGKSSERGRRDWIIILIILLLGFLCMLITGQWAIRFSPNWKLNADMESNIDPNSNFLTNVPVNFIEPLDPSILTQPVWVNVFLTPGAVFATGTPVSTSPAVNTPAVTNTVVSTKVTPSPIVTNTLPPPTRTPVYLPPTLTFTPGPSAIKVDLQITKTDGMTTYTGGTQVVYTIVVSNNSASGVTSAIVSDPKPSQVTTWSWACTSQTNGANGCTTMLGNANFTDTVNLPGNSSITYTVTANIAVSVTGNLVNTASVTVPIGYSDTNNANNSATDTDTQTSADLQITKTDGVPSYIAGGNVTYTITVSNAGPGNVTGAAVTDTFPAEITSAAWTCVSTGGATCTAGGSGNINDTVNIPVGGTLTYTVNAAISSSATGSISNTASVDAPSYADPNTANNSATDTDAQYIPSVDLAITKTDGVTAYVAGGNLTYTITVSNNGPDNVTGATVTDTFPAIITASWTCVSAGGASCMAGPVSGNINDTVNIPVGGTLTYTVNATVSAAATGSLVNTASVAVPSGYNDPVAGNNSDTDTDSQATIDLQITKTDGVATYTPGNQVTYTIVVSNTAGPNGVIGAVVTDTFPAEITSASWTCSGTAGTTCTAGGSGNINDTVNIPAGGSVTYIVNANTSPSATVDLVNTASVTAPSGYIGTTSDSATDTDVAAPSANLSITKTDNSTHYIANATKTYTIVISNSGPSNVTGATVTEAIAAPVNANITSWTCSGSIPTATCTPSGGAGNFTDNVSIPAGQTITYTVIANVIAAPSGNLVNTATVSSPISTTVSDTDTDILITSSTTPGQIGTTPDNNPFTLGSGNSLTLSVIGLVANGDVGYDFVYYEYLTMWTPPPPDPTVPAVFMDNVIIEIGDGSNWYTVFNWGNGSADTNSNISVLLSQPIPFPNCMGEPDNCQIDPATLTPYGSTGIAINIDIPSVPTGVTYTYLRFTAPNDAPNNDGMEIDAIQILP